MFLYNKNVRYIRVSAHFKKKKKKLDQSSTFLAPCLNNRLWLLFLPLATAQAEEEAHL